MVGKANEERRPTRVTTRIPLPIFRGLAILNVVRYDRITLDNVIDDIFYPQGQPAPLTERLRTTNLAMRIETPVRAINFGLETEDAEEAKLIARTKETPLEHLYTSYIAGYLALDAVRSELHTDVFLATQEVMSFASAVNNNPSILYKNL